MPTLNEVKYAALESLAAGKPATLNELEHDWLTLGGVPLGGTLNERYYTLFGKVAGSWNENARAWLIAQGVPDQGTLNEMFYVYWAGQGGGQINMPDLNLGVGSGGARHGYRRGLWGTANPNLLTDGNEIRDLYLNNNNGRVVFKVEGTYPQDEFASMEVVGYGTLDTATADLFDDSGGETFWRWNNTGWTWTDGDTLAVEFT